MSTIPCELTMYLNILQYNTSKSKKILFFLNQVHHVHQALMVAADTQVYIGNKTDVWLFSRLVFFYRKLSSILGLLLFELLSFYRQRYQDSHH